MRSSPGTSAPEKWRRPIEQMLWYYCKGKPKGVIELEGRLDINALSQESDARIDVILRGHGLAIADMASPLTLGENEIVRQLDESILDLFSRFTVSWAVSAVNDRHLTIKALDMALKRRGPDGGLLHHSDQGSPYASEDYQTIVDARGITCSMSRRGNCYDNAVMESLFSTVKSELRDRGNQKPLAGFRLPRRRGVRFVPVVGDPTDPTRLVDR
jgi:transposase InsO family protein